MRTAKLVPLTYDIPLEEAEELRRTDNPSDFLRGVLTEVEFMNIVVPERRFILRNLITEESITAINGFRGYGKSWLSSIIANEATWGGKVGPWDVVRAVNALIVDGEMPLKMIQDRLRLLNVGRDIHDKPSNLYLYPEAYSYRIGLHRASLLDPAWRERIGEAVDTLGIGLLVLDNLSSLSPGIDENEKMAFDAINRWLLELRFRGCAILMTHHTGKSGEQRGTSAHEDHLDTSLILRRPYNYHKTDGCKFVVGATKDRAHVTGGETHTLQLIQDEGGRLSLAITSESGLDQAVKLLGVEPNLTAYQAAERGVARATYFRAKKVLQEGQNGG